MKSLFALSSLIVLLAAPLAAEDYAIKMHQPLKVGQRYEFTTTVKESTETSVTGDPRGPKKQKQEQSVEFESVATVLEVDAQGRPSKESHSIVKLLLGAEKKSLLPAGTIVVASRTKRKMAFEIAGSPATGDVAAVLERALIISSGGPTDDQIFGTPERKKVGDSWPLNEALAMKDLNEKLEGSGLNIAGVEGTTTLQKVSNIGGVAVLHLVAKLDASVPPTAKGKLSSVTATMNATISGDFPEDISKAPIKQEMTLTMVLDASGKREAEGPELKVSTKKKRSGIRRCKLLQ